MPNFSGIWSAAQQFQARGQNIWPKPPCAPTGVTGTAGNAQVSVAFTAPSCTGKYPAGVATYTATSTPGCFTASGASSPLVVTGLTNCTPYTFKVKATGSNGLTGPCSAASGSATPVNAGQQAYTSAGTYSWVAPTGVTSVSAVVVSRGGSGYAYQPCTWVRAGGRGGTLAYKNNITVVPGNSYSVVVGQFGSSSSSFINCSTVYAQVGCAPVGDGGGVGGAGGYSSNYNSGDPGVGGGGAGGYSGAGGGVGASGSGGGGGGGTTGGSGTGGGGVGLLGEGASGGVNGGGSGGSGSSGTTGGAYGGGSASGPTSSCGSPVYTTPGGGAVRIIWPGNTRSFPSTNTGNL